MHQNPLYMKSIQSLHITVKALLAQEYRDDLLAVDKRSGLRIYDKKAVVHLGLR